MVSARSAHYWLWFLLLGVVSTLVDVSTAHSIRTISAESLWLLAAGLVGIILGTVGALSRPYDLVIGFFFTAVGIIGILHNFGVSLVAQNPTATHAIAGGAILGLSLALPYALIHTLIGFTSLNDGLKMKRAASSVVVTAPTAVEA
ncbi:MAG TPA: hypothetical protein VIC27_03700 [Ktedonobacterales bacterium]